jgi:predicted membrane GTPase involved in stress response
MNVYYHHSALEVGKPRVTVAGIIIDGILRLGVSRCSIKDNFIKAKGRMIAKARAEKRPSLTVSIPEGTEKPGLIFMSKAKMLIGLAQEFVTVPRFETVK